MTSRRPPLNRGHSMPTYIPSQSNTYGSNNGRESLETTISALARLNITDVKFPSGSKHPDASWIGSHNAADSSCKPSTSLSALYQSSPQNTHPQHSNMPHNTNNLNSSMSYNPYTHTPQASYYAPYPTYHPANSTKTRPATSQANPASSSSHSQPFSSLPTVTTPASRSATAFRGQSTARHRSNVPMTVETTATQYVLIAPLGPGFNTESITVTMRKENILHILADRWDQEKDCQHEWQVQFGRDADMSDIRAGFDNGILKITVKRLHMNNYHH